MDYRFVDAGNDSWAGGKGKHADKTDAGDGSGGRGSGVSGFRRKGQPCDEKPRPETFPAECYRFNAMPKGDLIFGGLRGTSMELVAKFPGGVAGSVGEIGRTVVDQTGLPGTWDFILEAGMPGRAVAPDASPGPTVLEAMRE